MNEKQNILFDLDGTLTDSGDGIINCAVYALEHFGLPIPPREELRVFVGPPLWDSFRRFGVQEAQLDEAVTVFRSRYIPIGKFENVPYEGIPEVLAQLQVEGHRLYIATSKPEVTAVEILEHFGLSQYFTHICGADFGKERHSKAEVIAYLLNTAGIGTDCVMVGDTAYDVLGANAFGIPTVGVSWGYGDTAEMVQAGAAAIVHSPRQLLRVLHDRC